MKVIDSPITDSIWTQLDTDFGTRIVVPEGFESIRQIAVKLKRGITSTKSLIRKLLEADQLDVITGRCGVRYYRPKNYAKQNKR